MTLIQKIKAWKSAQHPAALNLKNIFRVIRAYYRKLFPLIPSYISQQAQWRLTQIHPQCRQLDSCRICGCIVSGLVFDDAPCEGKCYPAMMNKQEWAVYKKENNIKL